MDSPMTVLEAYFKERNVGCFLTEPNGYNSYKNTPSAKLITNGVSVVYFEGYMIKSLRTNNTVWPNKLDTPEEVFRIVVNAIDGTLSQKINFILDATPDDFIQNQRIFKLEGSPRANYTRRSVKVRIVLKNYKNGTVTKEEANKVIHDLLTTPYHERHWMMKPLASKPIHNLGKIDLPVPLPKNFMLANIELSNFIYYEVLSTFPFIINHCIKASKGEGSKDVFLLYDQYKYVSWRKKQLINKAWVNTIKNSSLKYLAVNFCIDWLKIHGNHKKLVSNNMYIWDQLFVLYGICDMLPTMDLPEVFIDQVRKFQMVK